MAGENVLMDEDAAMPLAHGGEGASADRTCAHGGAVSRAPEAVVGKTSESDAVSDAAHAHDKPVRTLLARRVVLGVVFVAVATGIVLGNGFGTLASFGWQSIAAICPLGALESLLASKLLIPQALVALLLMAVVAIVLGKVFCAWVCPVPPVKKALDAVARKKPRIRTEKVERPDGTLATRLRVVRPSASGKRRAGDAADVAADAADAVDVAADPSSSLAVPAAGSCAPSACASCASGCASASRPTLDSRHLVLGGSLLSAAIFGFPVFCLVCPIGLTFATIIVIVQLFGTQTLSWGLLLFPLLLVLELTVLRKWCGRFCPMGALMNLLARPNRTFRPKVDEGKCLRSHGVDCQICAGVCPEGLDPHSAEGIHECSKCRDCAVNCPAGAITLPRR